MAEADDKMQNLAIVSGITQPIIKQNPPGHENNRVDFVYKYLINLLALSVDEC